jgi:hypothetical protein
MSDSRRQPPKWPTSGYRSMEYDNPGDPYKETEELIAKTLAVPSQR